MNLAVGLDSRADVRHCRLPLTAARQGWEVKLAESAVAAAQFRDDDCFCDCTSVHGLLCLLLERSVQGSRFLTVVLGFLVRALLNFSLGFMLCGGIGGLGFASGFFLEFDDSLLSMGFWVGESGFS